MRQPTDGHSAGGEYYGVGAGVGISGFRAIYASAMTSSAIERTPIPKRSGASAGTGMLMISAPVLKPKAKRVLMNHALARGRRCRRVIEQIKRGVVRERSSRSRPWLKDNDRSAPGR